MPLLNSPHSFLCKNNHFLQFELFSRIYGCDRKKKLFNFKMIALDIHDVYYKTAFGIVAEKDIAIFIF